MASVWTYLSCCLLIPRRLKNDDSSRLYNPRISAHPENITGTYMSLCNLQSLVKHLESYTTWSSHHDQEELCLVHHSSVWSREGESICPILILKIYNISGPIHRHCCLYWLVLIIWILNIWSREICISGNLVLLTVNLHLRSSVPLEGYNFIKVSSITVVECTSQWYQLSTPSWFLPLAEITEVLRSTSRQVLPLSLEPDNVDLDHLGEINNCPEHIQE